MAEEKLTMVGKGFSNINKGISKGDFWDVSVVMTETNYMSDGTEVSETIETSCVDRDFDTAHQLALLSAIVQLREETTDKGFVSLIEARRAAKELGNDTPKADTDTITQ